MDAYNHCHLIGIGGIGMSCVARLLLIRGVRVSGSDIKPSRITADLEKAGARVFIGHDPENIRGADLVIYSSAIKEDNPEISEAKRQGKRVIRRAQALAQLMADKNVITVTGSHGKTTTTSLVSCLLLEAGLMPTVAIGGILLNIDTNVCAGDGRLFVAEADESDGSFLYYRPDYSIITNIDYEHIDYYKDFQNALGAFREFLRNTKPGGCVFGCNDDANLKEMLANYGGKYVLFGLTDSAHIWPANIQIQGLSSQFDCFYKDKFVDRFYLALGGMHNISNSLAVIALGLELGIGTDIIKKALAGYKGTGRRIEIKFRDKDYLLIDDYAHHPTEIKATLAAIKHLGAARVIAVFQPHRFTRTKLLLDEFAGSFGLADYVIVTDIYAACEPPLPGVTGRCIYDKIKECLPLKEASYLAKDEIVRHVLEIIRPGDLVITLGAGDIVKISDELAQKLVSRSSERAWTNAK